MANAIDVTIVGGGMITCDLILPSIYHLKRLGEVNDIKVCALNSTPLKELKENEQINQAFPGQDFIAYPDVSKNPEELYPDLYKEEKNALIHQI